MNENVTVLGLSGPTTEEVRAAVIGHSTIERILKEEEADYMAGMFDDQRTDEQKLADCRVIAHELNRMGEKIHASMTTPGKEALDIQSDAKKMLEMAQRQMILTTASVIYASMLAEELNQGK